MALSDEQRSRMKQIKDMVRKQHWELGSKMMEEQIKLRDLLEEQTPDPKLVGATYGAIASLRQQMIETHLQAGKDVHALLTPEQRKDTEQVRRSDRDPDRDGYGHRRGMAPR